MNKNELNNIRVKITKLFYYGVVNIEDIRSLSNFNLFDVSNNYNSMDFKTKVLFDLNPYLLCDDNLLTSNPILSIEDISSLLIKRYNEEINELKSRYHDGEYNLDELYIKSNRVRKLYFDSSLIGRRIYHLFNEDIEIISKLDKKFEI